MASRIADKIERHIVRAVGTFNPKDVHDCPFSKLLSMGELVDRLTIVNIKLYNLKNEVMKRQKDKSFCAQAAVEDVALVMERARLKKCIDEKLKCTIKNADTYNPEVKSYK